jgi:hypothetical protein
MLQLLAPPCDRRPKPQRDATDLRVRCRQPSTRESPTPSPRTRPMARHRFGHITDAEHDQVIALLAKGDR